VRSESRQGRGEKERTATRLFWRLLRTVIQIHSREPAAPASPPFEASQRWRAAQPCSTAYTTLA